MRCAYLREGEGKEHQQVRQHFQRLHWQVTALGKIQVAARGQEGEGERARARCELETIASTSKRRVFFYHSETFPQKTYIPLMILIGINDSNLRYFVVVAPRYARHMQPRACRICRNLEKGRLQSIRRWQRG